MMPNRQLHIAPGGDPRRAMSLLEWSPLNGQWIERMELSGNTVYEEFSYDKDELPKGCVLPRGYEHLATKP